MFSSLWYHGGAMETWYMMYMYFLLADMLHCKGTPGEDFINPLRTELIGENLKIYML